MMTPRVMGLLSRFGAARWGIRSPGSLAPRLLTEIDWPAETPGTYPVSYTDSFGHLWTSIMPGTPGTMAITIDAVNGLVLSGTAGAANQEMSIHSDIGGLAPGYDPDVDCVEVYHTISTLTVGTAGQEVRCAIEQPAGHPGLGWFVVSINVGGVQTRRALMVHDVGAGPAAVLVDNAEAFASATFGHRIVGLSSDLLYKNAALSAPTFADMVKVATTRTRWGQAAFPPAASFEAAGAADWRTRVAVVGQPGSAVNATISKTRVFLRKAA